MRVAVFAILCCVVACDALGTKTDLVTVQWMDWPAEVNAGQTFRTRLVVSSICALNPRFHAGASADQSAVTFAPYFEADDKEIACIADQSLLISLGMDTAALAPALAATTARTYEMRAAAPTIPSSTTFAPLPVRTFGDVTVRSANADDSRRNAAGIVQVQRDTLGCVHVRPLGAYRPDALLPLEDQADTAGLAFAFVRGYIYDASAPVCGQTRVFHLTSRN